MDAYNGTFEMVDPRVIVVDHRFQRDEKPALIAAISTDPRWELFGVPVLFKRSNGVFYCADGQQRIAGVKRAAHPPKLIPALWFPVHGGIDEEAAVFVQINEFRKSLTALEKHKGKIVAKDPATLAIERALDTAGLSVAGKRSEEARTITAVSALYHIYENMAEEGLVQVLVVCRDAFEDDGQALSSPILKGVAEIIMDQNGDYNRQKLVAALKRTTVPRILRKAEELRFEMGGSRQRNIRRAFKVLAKV